MTEQPVAGPRGGWGKDGRGGRGYDAARADILIVAHVCMSQQRAINWFSARGRKVENPA